MAVYEEPKPLLTSLNAEEENTIPLDDLLQDVDNGSDSNSSRNSSSIGEDEGNSNIIITEEVEGS